MTDEKKLYRSPKPDPVSVLGNLKPVMPKSQPVSVCPPTTSKTDSLSVSATDSKLNSLIRTRMEWDVYISDGKNTRLKMVVALNGFELQIPKGARARRVAMKVLWKQIRSLKNYVLDRNCFVFEAAGQEIALIVNPKASNRELLAQILDNLPMSAYMDGCPYCGATMKAGKCSTCGRKAATAYRWRGMALFISGVSVILLGIALHVLIYFLINPKSNVLFFNIGFLVAGFAMIGFGIKQIVTGKKK